MKISVVIPARDESCEIAGAIESAAGSDVEILVVDGASRDDTVARAHACGARVLTSPPGRARQLQRGFDASSGEVVLFLHADTRLPAGWETAVRRCLADPDTCGGAFRFQFAPAQARPAMPFSAWVRASLRIVEIGARIRAAAFGLPYGDQALFLRRSALRAMGGVPLVPLMEDLDLVREVKRRGRLVLLPLAAPTSPRRYTRAGVLRTMLRHWLATVAWGLGVDRQRVARWVAR